MGLSKLFQLINIRFDILAGQATGHLINHVWQPIQTNTLILGAYYFSDPQWANYPSRFYGFS